MSSFTPKRELPKGNHPSHPNYPLFPGEGGPGACHLGVRAQHGRPGAHGAQVMGDREHLLMRIEPDHLANITKEVTGPHTCTCGHTHEGTRKVFDEDAYWKVDFEGNLSDEGDMYFAKVAFPSVESIKRFLQMEQDARAEEHRRNRAAYPRKNSRTRKAKV